MNNTIPKLPTMRDAVKLHDLIYRRLSFDLYIESAVPPVCGCWHWTGPKYEGSPVVYTPTKRKERATCYLVAPAMYALAFGALPHWSRRLVLKVDGHGVYDAECVNPFHMRLVRRG